VAFQTAWPGDSALTRDVGSPMSGSVITRFLMWLLLSLATILGGCADVSAPEDPDAQTSLSHTPNEATMGADAALPADVPAVDGGTADGFHLAIEAGSAPAAQGASIVSLDAGPALPNVNPTEPDAAAVGARDAALIPDDSSVTPVAHGGITADVKTVVIDLRNQQMGTILLPVPYPVVLFRDGSACLSTRVFTDGLDLVTHRSQFPQIWTEWRGEPGLVELRKGMAWSRLRYQGEYPALTKGTVFQGRYAYTSGSYFGIANGLAQRTYWFSADGTFAVDRSALLVTESGGAAGVSISPSESGQYEIEGYSITFRYGDGTSARASIVHGAADPSVVYINDAGFLKN